MKKNLVDWGFSCGRAYLTVCGHVVAMEGDPLRDFELGVVCLKLLKKKYPKDPELWSDKAWTDDLIKHVATMANGGVLPG